MEDFVPMENGYESCGFELFLIFIFFLNLAKC